MATSPKADYRTLLSRSGELTELKPGQVIDLFKAGDVLVINDTKVLKRRVFSENALEILFLKQLDDYCWEVLYPARGMKVGQLLSLPSGITMTLEKKGLPQVVKLSEVVSENYFLECGELPLPPYIQKARNERHNVKDDSSWYQTEWAKSDGSFAAPTASLHFSNGDIEKIKAKGALVLPLTLHVGLGTFLPVKTDNLQDHKMHSEWCYISSETIEKANKAKQEGGKVFALGTTVTRALESYAAGMLEANDEGSFSGETDIFITPGFKYKFVDVLMTNFHQPKSTLLALVSAFAGLENVKKAYSWAIERKFRLFSYGDFSVWYKD